MSHLGARALCVGGTSGIGEAIALKLASLYMDVTIVGTNETAGRVVIEKMKAINSTGSYDMIRCDATSMKCIKTLCESLKQETPRLDYLVLTQGMATTAGRTETLEGIDKKMSLHYYGRIQFIRELKDILSATALNGHDVRVMSILSGGVHKPYTIKSDLALERNYSVPNAADAAGFYNDLALDRFSREDGWNGVSFIHAAPGFVSTTWGKDFPFYLRGPLRLAQQMFAKSPESCANDMVEGMLSSAMKGGFHVMNPNGGVGRTTLQHTKEFETLVWTHTVDTIQQALDTPGEDKNCSLGK